MCACVRVCARVCCSCSLADRSTPFDMNKQSHPSVMYREMYTLKIDQIRVLIHTFLIN